MPKQALPEKQDLVRALLELARAQIKLEKTIADCPFDETTSFAQTGFNQGEGLIWQDYLGDVTERWLVAEDVLPEEAPADLNCISLAGLLLAPPATKSFPPAQGAKDSPRGPRHKSPPRK